MIYVFLAVSGAALLGYFLGLRAERWHRDFDRMFEVDATVGLRKNAFAGTGAPDAIAKEPQCTLR